MAEEPPWFPVRTQRLLLREFHEADFDDVHAYATDPQVSRFMAWGSTRRTRPATSWNARPPNRLSGPATP